MKFEVFTATATKTTKTRIFEILSLHSINTYSLEINPIQKDLMYSVQDTGNNLSTEQIFGKIIRAVENLEDKTERTIICCQTRTQCAVLWRTFSIKLGTKFYFN